jgi:hypothetical protein
MTLYTQAIAERASTEMNPGKLAILIEELCRALDDEHAQNGQLRRHCADDCREHSKPFPCD